MSIITNSAMSVAGTNTEVLELPANTVNAMSDINLVNTGATDAVVTVYIADVANPTTQHVIEWEFTLHPSEPLTRTCGPMKAGEKMYVLSTTADVAMRATAIIETL